MPNRLRPTVTAQDATIVVVDALDAAPISGVVLARRAGREQVICALTAPMPVMPARFLATGLRLPTDMVLHREVVLPLAAERSLFTVLNYEMDRLTPFEANEVFWGVSGLRRDPAGGLRLTLIVVLRAPVERLLEALGRIDLRPSFVETAMGRIALAARDRSGLAMQYLRNGLYAVLALVCVVIPLLRQQLALDQAARQVTALAPARQEALRLRHRLNIAQSGQAAVAAARQNSDPLQTLAALTAALPDGTSLNDLTLDMGELTVEGQSNDAAGLIAKLAAASPFLDPRFIAPVTRAADGQTELFSIHMTVAP